MTSIDKNRIDDLYNKLLKEAQQSGYHLNPDKEFVYSLLEGMLINEDRYGYQSCPCRLASGIESEDMDIICPCDYRDTDLAEYGTCYCALYVSEEVASGARKLESIPDRRLTSQQEGKSKHDLELVNVKGLPYPVWRCKVCGYLCARNEPPEICPICKAKKERFERFI